jgi:RNA polymerase sigma-70 factor (ECF subfamily)
MAMVMAPAASDLLIRISAGDGEAFALLVQPLLPALVGFATRVGGDREQAEDAVQDVLAQAFRTLRNKSRADLAQLAVRPWLFRSVLNRVRRNASRRKEVPAGLAPSLPAADNPERAAEERATVALVETALQRLPADWRAAILLHHHTGYDYEEVAAILGHPAGTVKAWVHRGIRIVRAALAAQMEDQG